MTANPTPWARKKLIKILTGHDYRSNNLEHEDRVSGQCYCYRVGSYNRIWVHRADPGARWFGVDKSTRDRLIDWRLTEKWGDTQYKDGGELRHILVVKREGEFVTQMRNASNPEDISNLNWYAFHDRDLPRLSTDKRGAAGQFYIKIAGSLERALEPYFQDGQDCLPDARTD